MTSARPALAHLAMLVMALVLSSGLPRALVLGHASSLTGAVRALDRASSLAMARQFQAAGADQQRALDAQREADRQAADQLLESAPLPMLAAPHATLERPHAPVLELPDMSVEGTPLHRLIFIAVQACRPSPDEGPPAACPPAPRHTRGPPAL